MPNNAQSDLRELAGACSMVMVPNISADGARQLIKLAYEKRARLNHLISRGEAALAELDPAYADLRKQLEL